MIENLTHCSAAHLAGNIYVIEETNVQGEFIMVDRANFISMRIVAAPQLPMFTEFQNLLKSHHNI